MPENAISNQVAMESHFPLGYPVTKSKQPIWQPNLNSQSADCWVKKASMKGLGIQTTGKLNSLTVPRAKQS